jgi:hypothetical protein
MPTLRSQTSSTFSTPVKAPPVPPVPKIPEMYFAPTVAPILKVNTQSLTASMANLRIATPQSSPLNPTLLGKSSFTSLRAASTMTPTKSSTPSLSPKASRRSLRRQSATSNHSAPATPTAPPTHLPTPSRLNHRSGIPSHLQNPSCHTQTIDPSITIPKTEIPQETNHPHHHSQRSNVER